jgi:hypothetical protein
MRTSIHLRIPAIIASLALSGFAQQKSTSEGITITKPEARRQVIEDKVAEVPRQPVVTSRDRTTPPSPAHDRGALDYRSNDISQQARHQEAQELSKSLGPTHTVVVEEVHRPAVGAQGPAAQVNTAYRNGAEGKTHTLPATATSTHTHVQPEVSNNKK